METALEIIDAQGFYALSMRGLARRLKVFPAAVYWHAGTKSELLALVSERVLEEIDIPNVDILGWQDWTLELGLRVRRVLGRHPRFASYFVTNIQVSRRALELTDATVGVLHRAGFRGQDLVDAYNSLFGSAFSWAAGEFADEDDVQDASLRSGQEGIEGLLADAGPRDLVNIRENWPTIANRIYGLRWSSGLSNPMDLSFERMLRTLIDGFAARLAQQEP